MNLRSARLLVLTAGTLAAMAATSFAQQDMSVPHGTPVIKLHVAEDGTIISSSYGERAATVYDANSSIQCATYLASSHILEDVSFGPIGPWSATSNNVLRTISIPVANSSSTPISFDLQIRLWDSADFTANPMIPNGATPIATITIPLNNVGNGIFDLNITPNTPPVLPDSQVFVEVSCFQRGTTTLMSGNPSVLWGGNNVSSGPGSSTASWGRDRNNNNIFEGGAVGAPPAEHNQSLFASGVCANQPTGLPIIITGDVEVTQPPATDLGVISDNLSRSDTFAAGQVRWYTFSVSGDVTDAARTFLDIVNVGSGVADTSMALYSSNGNLIWSDQESGPDSLAQLSFGIGRRGADGNGAQFDGYDGELLATDTFFLAVAGSPAVFTGAFAASSTGTEAGSITIGVRTNLTTNTLAPSVAPEAADLGILLEPGAQGVSTLPGLNNIIWSRFTTCVNIDGSSPTNYLDIDFAGSDPSGDADLEAFIFDESGNLLITSDDEGPNFFPQFSFGATDARGPYLPGGQVFAGENGALNAGTYYVATGHFDVVPLVSAESDGRFHVRPTGGDNLDIRVDFLTGVTECTSLCAECAADYNLDGGVTGDDVAAFFVDFENSAPCADVNLDGGVTGDDVAFFFTVFENGGC